MYQQPLIYPLTAEIQEKFLLNTIAPMLKACGPITLVEAMRRIRESTHPEIRDRLLPGFETWQEHLPDDQMTWLGDDLVKTAPILAAHAYPELTNTVGTAIQWLGTDRAKTLVKGVFEHAKGILSVFEASLFTFALLYMTRPDLCPSLPSEEENENG